VLSVLAAVLFLRLFGYVEPFSVCLILFKASRGLIHWIRQTLRYLSVVVISAVLEALSDQNDNLILPLYMWSMLVVVV
jgi:dolichol kinase